VDKGLQNALDKELAAYKKLKEEKQKRSEMGIYPTESHIEIMDKIYTKENIKLSKKIAKLRELISRGVSLKEKTMGEEMLEELEARVILEHKHSQIVGQQ
tara:strand:- start:1989 stop:2288 length:300 start_codon:yes stop_codon:yes gene_type:complete